MRKYSGIHLDDPLGQGMLKLHFVTNSWPDIAKKLQKLEHWKDRSMEALLRGTQSLSKEGCEAKTKSQDNALHN